MARRTYQIKQNPKTGSFLRNKEVYCERCFDNFGDIYTLEMHKTNREEPDSECIPPKNIPLTPQRNFSGAVVWRVTF